MTEPAALPDPRTRCPRCGAPRVDAPNCPRCGLRYAGWIGDDAHLEDVADDEVRKWLRDEWRALKPGFADDARYDPARLTALIDDAARFGALPQLLGLLRSYAIAHPADESRLAAAAEHGKTVALRAIALPVREKAEKKGAPLALGVAFLVIACALSYALIRLLYITPAPPVAP